ncbi:MAG: RNase adapter RapZ [Alphaproteobacteria bacterium HGW-Alphaproteobacteria-2]|nr:MAG: RNase adapter RapZ [Alphaproteobacteria bacterium HGW-Alphaproteobacteria-2]
MAEWPEGWGVTHLSQEGAVQELAIVTGRSGAGRSTAISALEDVGFEAIDNVPCSLVPRLFEGRPPGEPLALGIDTRSRGFSTAELLDLLERIETDPSCHAQLIFLDCSETALMRRFSETRRRHPFDRGGLLQDSLRQEKRLLAPLRARADVLIDTSEMTPGELRKQIARWFGREGRVPMEVNVLSFSYKRGLPLGADLVIDCRFLDNPHWQAALRARDGQDAEVAAFVAADPRHAAFMKHLQALFELLLPAYREEGRAYLTLAFGCTGGRHRSVAVAAEVAQALGRSGWPVMLCHRDLDRMARVPGADMEASP